MAVDTEARLTGGPPDAFKTAPVRLALPSCLLVVLTVAAHVPGIRGQFISDDHLYITKNQLMRDGDGLRRIWTELGATSQYYPLTFSSFWAEHRLWGSDPAGYHAVNISLHALNTFLLYAVLQFLGLPGAWLMAAVFSLHPVNVASVAWVSERKNVLSTAFYLASLLCYMRFLGLGLMKGKASSAVFCAAGLLLFACALLSKTVTCTLPPAILILIWWRRRRIDARTWFALAPMFAAATVLGAITIYAERSFSGAATGELALSALERLLVAGRSFWHYVGIVLWPARLSMVQPKWQIDPANWQDYLFPVLAVAALAGAWLARQRIDRGALAAVLLFTVTLLPVMGIVSFSYMQHSFVADHFVYLPCIPMIALAVSAGANLLGRLPRSSSIVRLAAGGVLVAGLAMATWRRSVVYASGELLWDDTIAKNPGSFMAYNGRGACRRAKGQFQEAITDLNRAIELKPNHAPAYHNRANAHYAIGDLSQAMADYSKVIALTHGTCGARYVAAYAARGAICIDIGDHDQAVADFSTAIKMAPHVAKYFLGRGTAQSMKGEHHLAMADYDQAILLKPNYSKAYVNRGESNAIMGNYDRAIADLSKAIELDPDFTAAYYQRAKVFEAMGRKEQAARDFSRTTP